MRTWKLDGWTDFDWSKIGNVSGELLSLAADLDADYGGGGGGMTPADLDRHIDVLENTLRRLKEVRSGYVD